MGNEFKFLRGEKFQVYERINLRDVSYRLYKYPKKYLSVRDLHEVLKPWGISPRTIRHWIQKGFIKKIKRKKLKQLVTKKQVKKFLSFLEARSEDKYARKEFRKKRKGMWNVFIPIRQKRKE